MLFETDAISSLWLTTVIQETLAEILHFYRFQKSPIIGNCICPLICIDIFLIKLFAHSQDKGIFLFLPFLQNERIAKWFR